MFFLEKYLDPFYYNQLIDSYEERYLDALDSNNVKIVVELFEKYNFYFIPDIVLSFLEIFELKEEFIETKLLLLKDKLGNDYVNIIGKDLRYLEYVLMN